MKKRPVMLLIMDGYGLASSGEGNAISLAKKPVLDGLMAKYDTKTLDASGSAVGLPDGQMGNSEVGHMNIGAGRVVWQSLSRINNAIKNGDFNKNEAFLNAIKNVKDKKSKFHIFGLCSDGGVHSHTDHIIALANLAHEQGIENVYYHAFLDGRDVDPKSAAIYLQKIVAGGNVKVATVGGRYYGMDRDKNYNRIQVAYDAMTQAKGKYFPDPFVGIEESYKEGITDEFIVPFVSDKSGMVEDGDSVVFANFRPDRAIQIASAISNPEEIIYNCDKPDCLNADKGPHDIFFVSMMKYSDVVKGALAFPLQSFDNLFGDWVASKGKKQLRIAETEKYAHVTFFFDGGVDREIPNADRILVNSPCVATYDLQPEMSAFDVTDKVVEAIASEKYDVIIMNYANCDMVGHTGIIPAAIASVEAVDACVGRCVEALEKVGGVAVITADHGNAEKLLTEDGKPFTPHTTNLVPVLITDPTVKIRDGVLSDLAPTLLELMGLDKPTEMTSSSLIIKE